MGHGEPIRDPQHPLISHPRVVTTPHLGSATHEAELKVAIGTANEVLSALAGKPVQTAVNAPMQQEFDLARFKRPHGRGQRYVFGQYVRLTISVRLTGFGRLGFRNADRRIF